MLEEWLIIGINASRLRKPDSRLHFHEFAHDSLANRHVLREPEGVSAQAHGNVVAVFSEPKLPPIVGLPLDRRRREPDFMTTQTLEFVLALIRVFQRQRLVPTR